MIDLQQLEHQMKLYVREEAQGDLTRQLIMGHFLLWLTKRQETANGKTKTDTTRTGDSPVQRT